MKRKELVIFGLGDLGQIANYYFESDSEYEVVAFTAHNLYVKGRFFEGKKVVPFEILEDEFNKNNVEIFIAISYSNMNMDRERIFHEVKSKGYELASYISSRCQYLSAHLPGENSFILENNVIQPFVHISDNVTLWSGNHIGHHSTINSHNFISSHVVVSGNCTIHSNCFLGVNATITHGVNIRQKTLVGAGVIMTKDSQEEEVYIGLKPIKSPKLSLEIKF